MFIPGLSTARQLLFGGCILLACPLFAQTESTSRIDQSRQFNAAGSVTAPVNRDETAVLPASDMLVAGADDAFGAQQLLKREEKVQPFSAFAEVAAFVTNNVALTSRAAEGDTFMVATSGVSYRRTLRRLPQLQVEAAIRVGLFRYADFGALDFQSLDVGGGIMYSPAKLPNTAFFARYSFTDLSTAHEYDSFFCNHTLTVGAQKVWPLARAHALFAGTSAQWSWSDPQLAQRDEYSLYAGYQLQATRQLQAAVSYRFGYFVYREEGDREDRNHALSASLRYDATPWAAVSGSIFSGFNRSNQEVFDYNVVNAGGALGVAVRF